MPSTPFTNLLELSLPKAPDLVVESDALNWTPNAPVEADSALALKFHIVNYGLATQDSVDISIVDSTPTSDSRVIYAGKLGPVGFADSMAVT